jgi:hypothetical protein
MSSFKGYHDHQGRVLSIVLLLRRLKATKVWRPGYVSLGEAIDGANVAAPVNDSA